MPVTLMAGIGHPTLGTHTSIDFLASLTCPMVDVGHLDYRPAQQVLEKGNSTSAEDIRWRETDLIGSVGKWYHKDVD